MCIVTTGKDSSRSLGMTNKITYLSSRTLRQDSGGKLRERLHRYRQVTDRRRGLLFRTDSPRKSPMKIVRLYTGPDHESHFEDIEVVLNTSGSHMQASALQPAHGVMFRTASTNHLSSYHPAPRRQYVITLS